MNADERKTGRPRKAAPNGIKQLLLLRPVLVDICGGDRGAALMLSLALKLPDGRADAGGFFTATQAEFAAKTGLDRYQQLAGRKMLRDCGLITEQMRGLPALLYYRVNQQAVRVAVSKCACEGSACA